MVNRVNFSAGTSPVSVRRSNIHKLKNRLMKNLSWILLFAILPLAFAGCDAIGDIFKAGIWVGIIVIVAIIAIIGFLVKMFKK